MNFFHFLLATASLLLVSMTPAPVIPMAPADEIHFGALEATAGLNPQTGRPSGWYTSEVRIPVNAPDHVLANGQPLANGRLVVSAEGRQQIEFQAGPFGQAQAVTQFVSIDQTPPRVTWITMQRATFSSPGVLEAEIADPVSGICVLEVSFDQGQTWGSQFFPSPLPGESGPIRETLWSDHLDFKDFSQGHHQALLRAADCAGNRSPAQPFSFQIK